MILVGDLVLAEVLQGFPDERQAEAGLQTLERLAVEPMVGRDVAVAAARNYRRLRSQGITIRRTIDLLIGTFCIERGHALHGLAHWADWTIDQAQAARASASFVLVPSDGYPWRLALSVVYELTDDGLTTTVTARNAGTGVAPYGTAPHPYLVAGEGRVDDWSFTLPAASYLEVTDDRLVPVGTRPVGDRDG